MSWEGKSTEGRRGCSHASLVSSRLLSIFIAVVTLIALSGGCSSHGARDETGSVSSAIDNGTPDNDDLYRNASVSLGNCSGTLISPVHVLTANHCITGSTQKGAGPGINAQWTSAALPARATASELIAGEKPDHILHAGDIGDLAVLAMLAEIAPTSAVRGNIDVQTASVPDALTIEFVDEGESVLRLLMLHIAVAGPKIRADAARRAAAAGAALVVCGHSHIPFIGRDRGLTVFNPGSIGPRRTHLPIVFGVLELKDCRMSVKHVDCETGAQWLP